MSDGYYFRKAFLSVGGGREVLATNVNVTISNRAGIRTTDAAVGQYDDTAPASFEGSFNVIPATSGGIDYMEMVVTPGKRFHGFRFSTADGVLELEGTVKSVAETQPDNPDGHERTVTVGGIVKLWRATGR